MTGPVDTRDGGAGGRAGDGSLRWTGVPSPVVRLAGLGLVVAGAAHLLWPGALLSTARVAYDLALDVRFEPRDGATVRVRLAGVAMVATGAHLAAHGRVGPGRT